MRGVLVLGLGLALGLVQASTVGRFSAKTEAEWPLSELRFVVERETPTTALQLTFDCSYTNCSYWVDLSVNCGAYATAKSIAITAGSNTVDVDSVVQGAKALTTLELQIIKVTETNTEGSVSGTMALSNVAGGKLIKNAATCQKPKSHKLLVFGDSLTCGFGVLGSDPCPFTGETESARLAWAGLTADSLNVDVNIVAWSGKGMVRNYGEKTSTSAMPLPAYYNSTLGSRVGQEGNYWEPSNYSPDLVIVYLGANDYSTNPHPTDDEFIGGYLAFVDRIRKDYPAAKLLLLTDNFSASDNGALKVANVQKVAQQTGAAFFRIPDSVVVLPHGCVGHPNQAQQRNMAAAVSPVVASLL